MESSGWLFTPRPSTAAFSYHSQQTGKATPPYSDRRNNLSWRGDGQQEPRVSPSHVPRIFSRHITNISSWRETGNSFVVLALPAQSLNTNHQTKPGIKIRGKNAAQPKWPQQSKVFQSGEVGSGKVRLVVPTLRSHTYHPCLPAQTHRREIQNKDRQNSLTPASKEALLDILPQVWRGREVKKMPIKLW